jgi:hypothetical protein
MVKPKCSTLKGSYVSTDATLKGSGTFRGSLRRAMPDAIMLVAFSDLNQLFNQLLSDQRSARDDEKLITDS